MEIILLEYLPEDNSGRLNPSISREKAFDLLRKYNSEPFHIQHAETVEGVMRYFAQTLGYDREVDFWGLVGLLHDLDFEQFPEQHCIKVREILTEEGFDPQIIRAIVSHAYGFTQTDVRPSHPMEKVLYAVDELTGLIGAAILMRPSKSTLDLTTQSLKKKFKDKKFAAGCSREVILRGAQALGWELDYLMDETIKAMQELEKTQSS
ncbi:hydrolase [Seramator thermalis]|uniref:hydrolase n=1 Tax=Seramator thermalis TaxID=2496270 RepID=UPI00101D721F|nr:hydrolase [Seramator thermalis]